MKGQEFLTHSLLVCVIAVASFTYAPQVNAGSLDQKIEALQFDVPRFREIIHVVARKKGYPTKQLHDEFWGLILTRLSADPNKIRNALSDALLSTMRYQKELWKCIKLSALHHSVVESEQLEALSTTPTSKITEDYAERQKMMLQAAATGRPYVTRSGRRIKLSASLAERNMARIAAVEKRLRNLFNPDWQ